MMANDDMSKSLTKQCRKLVVRAVVCFLAGVAAIAGASPVAVTATANVTVELTTAQARAISVEFERVAQAMIDTGQVVGMSAAIVHRGEVLSARGYGITSVDDPQQVDADTRFRLASLTKGISGTAAALMVREGLIQWDEPVAPLLTQFELADPIDTSAATVRDLLTHRLGLPFNALDRQLEGNALYPDLVARLREQPSRCPVGECYGYQNIAFSLIGDLAFSTSGEFFEVAVTRRLFLPLGMTRAIFGIDGLLADNNWAHPHLLEGRSFNALMPLPTYFRVAPAAGANASANDMAQWMLAQLGHRLDVLDAELLEELRTPMVATPGELERVPWRRTRVQSAYYGLGWRIYDYSGHRLIFHGGAVQGFRGVIALLPEQDFGLVLLWNNQAALPAGLVPTVIDRALGLAPIDWVNLDQVTRLPVIRPRQRVTRIEAEKTTDGG